MKVELDIEDLKTTIDGLNNAFIALADIRNSMFFSCDVPEKWEFLKGDNLDNVTEKIDKRLNALKTLYNQLTKVENAGVV